MPFKMGGRLTGVRASDGGAEQFVADQGPVFGGGRSG
jgi:hypothetical protein